MRVYERIRTYYTIGIKFRIWSEKPLPTDGEFGKKLESFFLETYSTQDLNTICDKIIELFEVSAVQAVWGFQCEDGVVVYADWP